MSRFLFRVDGSPLIGYGHIFRTLSIAHELIKRGHNLSYLSKADPELRKLFERSEIDHIFFERDHEGNDIEILKQYIDQLCPDSLLIDSYAFNESDLRHLKDETSLLISIDDNGEMHFPSHIVINGNAHADKLDYSGDPDTDFLLGLDYSMLREKIRTLTPRERTGELERLLITLGGSDINDYTPVVLEAINHLFEDVDVVIGPGFKPVNVNRIKEIAGSKNIELHFQPQYIEVIMNRADLAISAAGSTLYELIALNVPLLAIIQADNQMNLARELDERGLIINLGHHASLTKDRIREVIKSLVESPEIIMEMHKNQKKYSLLNGVTNIVNRIEKRLGS